MLKRSFSRYTPSVSSLQIIYASTSGHTEYVVDQIIATLTGVKVEKQRAEQAQPEDLLKGDILLLASGSWNTGGAEGQLNPHMHELLKKRATGIDLAGKKVLLVGLGDQRYRYLVGAMTHMMEFVKTHGGVVVEPVLKVVNEPYGQEKKVEEWATVIRKQLSAFSL